MLAVASWHVGMRPGWGIVPPGWDRSSHYEEWAMPRSQGFSRGDLDTAFPLDDKFLSLRGRLTPEQYYAAAGVYFTIVAATWREADRKPGIRVAPDAGPIIDELKAAGLLDSDGRVTTRAFTSWIGRARRQRKLSSERQARNRAGMSRSVTRDTPSVARESQPARDSAPPRSIGTAGTEGENVAREADDALDVYFRLTGTFPSGNAKKWIGEMAAEFGDGKAGDAIASEFTTGDRATILKRAQNRLRSDAEKAERTKAAKETERQETARRNSGVSPEQAAAQRAAIHAMTAKVLKVDA